MPHAKAFGNKCIAVFSWIVHGLRLTMKTVDLFVRQVGRPRRLEVGFSHYLALIWISVNKSRLGLCSTRAHKNGRLEEERVTT